MVRSNRCVLSDLAWRGGSSELLLTDPKTGRSGGWGREGVETLNGVTALVTENPLSLAGEHSGGQSPLRLDRTRLRIRKGSKMAWPVAHPIGLTAGDSA